MKTMKIIQLELRDDFKRTERAVRGRPTDPSHVRRTIARENTAVSAPNTDPVLVFLKGAIPARLYNRAFQMWWPAATRELSNRFSATGHKGIKNRSGRIRIPDDILKTMKERQGMLGYVVGPHGCYETPLSREHPELLTDNRELIELVSSLYQKQLPTLHAWQLAHVINKPHLFGTPYTTAYFVKSLECHYHQDGRNLPGSITAIMPMGEFSGGELVLARYGIKIAYRPGDLLLFDAKLFHGNLPFAGLRMSAVYYTDRNVSKCGATV